MRLRLGVFAMFFFSVVLAQGVPDNNGQAFFDTLWKHQHRIFLASDFTWSSETYQEYYEKMAQHAISPTPGEKRERAFKFYTSLPEVLTPYKKNEVAALDTLSDLSFFCGTKDPSVFFASCIDRTKTELGKVFLYATLACPMSKKEDVAVIVQRQDIIRALIQDKELAGNIDILLASLQKPENALLWIYSDQDLIREVKDEYQTSGLKALNNNEYLLHISTIFKRAESMLDLAAIVGGALLLPLYAYSLIAKSPLKSDLHKGIQDYTGYGGTFFQVAHAECDSTFIKAAVALGGGVACAMSISKSAQWIKDYFYFEMCIQKIVMQAARYLNNLKNIHACIARHKNLVSNLKYFHHLEAFFKKILGETEEITKLFELIKTSSFQGKPSHLAFKGRLILAFQLFETVNKYLQGSLLAVAEIDMYRALARLWQEHQEKSFTYCFVTYKNQESYPYIMLGDFWNPFVVKNPVTNSLFLGCLGERRNALVTGPNEGGKSTMLKAVALSLIMAQTVGMVPARECTLTPFAKITTHLNVTDDIGQGNSLFKAEVLKARTLLDDVKKLKEGEFSFAAFDEMFNSTNPTEGTAAAYSVAYHLGKNPQSICMLATHFPVLTRLEQATEYFTNYKVSVTIERHEGKITIKRPYRLEKGISQQHIAIDTLSTQEFDAEIVQTAQDIVAQSFAAS